MSIDKISKSIIKGIEESAKDYKDWSNGYWLSDSPIENLMQVYIAKSCFHSVKNNNLFVHLEGDLGYFFGKEAGGRRRSDIIISDSDDMPIYIIEIKRAPSGYERDAKKISDMLCGSKVRFNSKLKAAYWAIFIVYKSNMKKDPVSKINDIKKKFYSAMKEFNLYYRGFHKLIAKDINVKDERRKEFIVYKGYALVVKITRKRSHE